MKKSYKIEENVDFYEELKKSLESNDDEEEEFKKENMCLITNKPLIENYITLDCKHTFNYEPLYNDVYQHKYNFYMMEPNKLKSSQLRCPYCRQVQNKLLPYNENMKNVKKTQGVNFDNSQPGYWTGSGIYFVGVCNIQPADNIQLVNNCCISTQVTLIPGLNKTFCSLHKHLAVYNHNKDTENKEKQEKQEKIKIFLEALNAAKLAEKQAKDDKKLADKQLKDDKKLAEKQLKDDKKLADKQTKDDKKLADKQAKDDKKLADKQLKNDKKLADKQKKDNKIIIK